MRWRIKFTKMAREEFTYEIIILGENIFEALNNFYEACGETEDTRFYTVLSVECLVNTIIY